MNRFELERRDFMQAMGGGALAAASVGLAMNLLPTAAEAAQPVTFPDTWDEELDFVIIGTGYAGYAAAIEIGRSGGAVTMLEKNPVIGGNSIISGGGFCCWTDKLQLRQKLNRGEDSADLHYQDILRGGDYYNIPDLARVMADGAPEAMNLLIEEGGLELRPVLNRIGGHSAYRGHVSSDSTGRPYIDAQTRIANKYNIKVRTENKVERIWRKDPQSPVEGIRVEVGGSRSKKNINIKVKKGLVIASGGFGSDVAMRSLFNPNITPAYNCTNQKNATGEMIRYAQSIGADVLQLCFIQLYPTADPDTGTLDAYALYPSRAPGNGGIFVNTKGVRFVSELGRRDVVSRAEIATGADRAYCIFSEAMLPKFTVPEDVEKGIKVKRVFKADTIAELAKTVGLPEKELENTVTQHNQFFADKKDPQFNKQFTPQMMPLDKGPFYIVAQWPAVHHCMGGLRINASGQVMDIWGDSIPNLYAGGEVTGGIHGANRLGGNAIPDALVFGKVAGAAAVAKAPKL
jgi:fumarate reductase flavoprotein subunit